MPMQLLFEGQFNAYVAAARQDALLWLFVHVPKTAGSSLGTELARIVPPYHNILVDDLDAALPWPQRLRMATDTFLAAVRERGLRSASGHIENEQVEQVRQALPGARLVTMLRHPLARIVSDYRYQRSAMNPRREEVMRRIPDFRTFMELPGQRNRAARHLVPMAMVQAQRAEEAIAYILRHYAFVGTQEMYGDCFRLLTLLASGAVHSDTERRRVNEEVEPLPLDPGLVARVEELNDLDMEIFRHVHRRLRAVQAPLREWLAQQPQAGRQPAAAAG